MGPSCSGVLCSSAVAAVIVAHGRHVLCCKATVGLASSSDVNALLLPLLLLQVHVAEKLGIPLHVLLTIPWLPTQHIAHPWARAFDKNVTEWAQDAAEALLAPVCGLVGLFKPSWALRLRHWVLSGVTAAANRFSTPLLDHTAW